MAVLKAFAAYLVPAATGVDQLIIDPLETSFCLPGYSWPMPIVMTDLCKTDSMLANSRVTRLALRWLSALALAAQYVSIMPDLVDLLCGHVVQQHDSVTGLRDGNVLIKSMTS